MALSYKGKTGIVTGGGSGIGKAIALRLAKMGMNVAIAGRNKARLESAAEEIEKCGAKALVIAADLIKLEDIERIVSETAETFGSIDVLVNNAGLPLGKPFEECSWDEFNDIMNTNARAPFFLCQKASPYLKKSDCGAIVNISSVVGHKGYIYQSIYSASKHALSGLTKAIAKELQDSDVRVHLISPGGVYTEMVGATRPELDPTFLIKPDDIAEIVEFLLVNRGNAIIDSIDVRRISNTPFV